MAKQVENRKAVIISAPSGAGKTTLVKHLLASHPWLSFSVSACSRTRREGETHGRDYYFIMADEFRRLIAAGEFVEWEEVYPGSYYGTLKSELERIWSEDCIPVFDVDVVGGLNLKRYFGDDGLAIFVMPPSPEILHERLRNRGTEDEESLAKRVSKADFELGFSGRYDRVIVNDIFSEAAETASDIIRTFTGKQ